MSWRTVVITESAKLDYQKEYLVVRKKEITKIFIKEISVLVLESTAVSMTAVLLSELVKNKVKVIFCDEKRNPLSELVPFSGSYDTSGKIRQQIAWSAEIKKLVWTEIVSEKIRKQRDFLKELGKEEYKMLDGYLKEMKVGDTTNREGHSAKVYFNALFGKDFVRSEENAINGALNYGYAILRAICNREIAINGYINQIGIFHDNATNPENLGCDLMEVFRVMIDRFVYRTNPEELNSDIKHMILELFNKEVLIDNKKQILDNAIKIYCRSVFDSLNEKDCSYLKSYSFI